jgi:hypothetical protein
MTHSNFPIWSKLLMYYLCKNARFAPGGRRSVVVPCARGRTTSSMGIVDVQAITLKTHRLTRDRHKSFSPRWAFHTLKVKAPHLGG